MSIWAGLGGLLGGAFNMWSTHDTNESNEDNVERTNATNLAIARERNSTETALWREQAEYNSPAAQMKRLEAAGLNPNLAYGQVAESKMSAPPSLEVPRMESFRRDPVRIDNNPIAEYQQVKNLQAMNQLRNVEIVKAKSEAIEAAANASYAVYENNKLQSGGTVKGDSPLFRNIGRAWELIKDAALPKHKLELYQGPAERAHFR